MNSKALYFLHNYGVKTSVYRLLFFHNRHEMGTIKLLLSIGKQIVYVFLMKINDVRTKEFYVPSINVHNFVCRSNKAFFNLLKAECLEFSVDHLTVSVRLRLLVRELHTILAY